MQLTCTVARLISQTYKLMSLCVCMCVSDGVCASDGGVCSGVCMYICVCVCVCVC